MKLTQVLLLTTHLRTLRKLAKVLFCKAHRLDTFKGANIIMVLMQQAIIIHLIIISMLISLYKVLHLLTILLFLRMMSILITMPQKEVHSTAFPLKVIFTDKFDVDFYQRQYVWERKHLEDLVTDLSNEFLKNWNEGDGIEKVRGYDPYFMGEIVLSSQTFLLSIFI